jgi:alcohol dehydrogenase (NADP+)
VSWFDRVAAHSASLDDFKHIDAERHDVGDDDVAFDISFCGLCHTDIHFVENDLGNTMYPLTPGHELIGTVTSVGSNVTKFSPGDKIGVGCMVDSCKSCKFCAQDEEQYCATGSTFTYGGVTQYGRAGPNGKPTIGGYSNKMVVNENFAIKVPAEAPLDKSAPLLCAGITMYDPLKAFDCKPGMRVGIAGVGGLGQMGIKIAAAMGATVIAISRSPDKEADAKAIGAHEFLVSTDENAMKAAAGSMDLILDTISACHDAEMYSDLLATKGTLVMIGLQMAPVASSCAKFLFKRISITGSLIGGIKNTQEMMDFCVSNNIYPDIEVIKTDKISECMHKLKDGNDRIVRYVLDCSSI